MCFNFSEGHSPSSGAQVIQTAVGMLAVHHTGDFCSSDDKEHL